jgi:LPS export ABC transporter protein LptC
MDDSGSILAVPIRLTLFDTLGDTTTQVLSDSGRTTEGFKHIFIWGNVYIKNQEGLIVKSQSLWWDKASRKVGSDDFVEIRNPDGNVLRGKGLDASDSFSWWTLRENVSGEFPNFQDRVTAHEDTL